MSTHTEGGNGSARLWVLLPESGAPAHYDAGSIALWVAGNVSQVLRVTANSFVVKVDELHKEKMDGGSNGSRICHLTIDGIPAAARSRIKDLLNLTGMRQIPSPDGGTDEFFDVPGPAGKRVE